MKSVNKKYMIIMAAICVVAVIFWIIAASTSTLHVDYTMRLSDMLLPIVARPLAFFAAAAALACFFKPVKSNGLKIAFICIAAAIVVVYAVLTLAYGGLSDGGRVLTLWLVNNPWIFIVPGALLTLGVNGNWSYSAGGAKAHGTDKPRTA